ncbi:MAG TPA: DNA translocase FtsK [Dehalococcoidia bacterium]|nr:DNA translocase FtsK [Dehalococcoidia bacterium]
MTILLSILTSSWMGRLLPLAIAAGLIIGFWGSLLRIFGVGIALLILAVAILIWAIWQRHFSPFLQWWNRWLGAIAFAAALLGCLAFFNPDWWISGIFGKDVSLKEISLGGNWGTAIIGSQGLVGALRIVGIVIVGTALVSPRFTWQLLKEGIKRIISVWRQLAEWGQSSVVWLRRFYSQHPVHQLILDWIKKRRAPAKVEGVPPLSPPQPGAKPPQKVKVTPRETPKVAPTPTSFPSLGGWQLPSIDLLDETVEVKLSQAEIEKRAKLIEEALASYGVEAKVVQMNVGPTVTQFGVEPGWDRKYKEIKERDRNGNLKARVEEVSRTRVKVERITSLANDLALALAAPSIRIEAPVPGKSVVGIEVPNSSMGLVSLREIMESTAFQKLSSKSKLALALGKGTASEIVVGDLAKMPHLLIAGATGSGKTICLNSIIASLLMKTTPEELKFIMIDPKRVELVAFNTVPHLMAPVITEKERAAEILKWLNQEMDNRYRKLAQVRVRNIEGYNQSNRIEKPMPYLIPIIDELADLMMAKSEEVEPLLCRLAQMGRAVGIHLVVATQRPSVDVVTGLIKANFPTRISFAVASQVDSRTILDTVGAEKLLGRGDMLYLPPEMAKPKRLQGCFASPEEIERLVSFWSEQSRAQPTETLAYEEGTTQDPILEEARRLVKEHKQISVSFLQRQLRIGYPRAERLMQQLEEERIGKDEEKPPDIS